MPSREELESHPVTTLKKEISKTNIKGYSKMKKPEVVELMLKNKDRFHHIKMAEKKTKKEKPKEDKPKEKLTSTRASGKVTELKLKEAKPKKKKLIKKKKKKKKKKEKPVEKPKSKPKAKLSELDSMEKSILDDLEKQVKKNKYSDQLDVYELLDVGEGLEKPLRKRTLEIIEKIVKKKSLRTLFPLKDLKKRLKLS